MNFADLKKYLSEILILSFPILAGNIGQMLISLGDVYVAGHYSTNVLAAISVASAIFMTFVITGIGLCTGITPVISNYRGQRQPVKKFFVTSVIYSQILALIFFGLLWLIIPLVNKMGLSTEILSDTILYLKISTFSVFGIFLYTSLREYLQAHEKVIFANTIMVFAVGINLALNFIFVYGLGKIPEMGTAGLAIASLIVRTLLALSLLGYCFKFFKNIDFSGSSTYIKDLIKTGAPISGAMFIEFLGFNVVAVLLGSLAPVYAACHNIIISITSVSYMIPFSVSCALSVKVGYANGKKDVQDIKKYVLAALSFMLVYSILAIVIYVLFKEPLMKAFSSDSDVIKTGVSIMLIVACFTVFDAIQGICMGALKGLKQTLKVFIVMFLSYILISIPTGIFLAFRCNLTIKGFWIGLAAGIIFASISSSFFLMGRYRRLKILYSN